MNTDYPQKCACGRKLDPYRVMLIYGIAHPAHQHAIKKLLRAGDGHNNLPTDIKETIASLQRWLEMVEEDAPPTVCSWCFPGAPAERYYLCEKHAAELKALKIFK